MAATRETVRLEGFQELQKAMKLADKQVRLQFRGRLRKAAEPVRSDAEVLAVQRISHIGVPWSRMRVGITQTSVYVAPRERGRNSRKNPKIRRPNLARLMMGQSMLPALRQNESNTLNEVDKMLQGIGLDWERV